MSFSIDREKILPPLETTKANLICALKTERILRENRAFINRNSELLANHLAAVHALQVSDEAREYSRLLDEALRIAQDVQTEMRTLDGEQQD
ncbi:MAG: hypothetical protein LDL41_01730 [Coleofasciculus sp. S288]|nr:hypothetical protein [Coleofasciculus sp. S288]